MRIVFKVRGEPDTNIEWTQNSLVQFPKVGDYVRMGNYGQQDGIRGKWIATFQVLAVTYDYGIIHEGPMSIEQEVEISVERCGQYFEPNIH